MVLAIGGALMDDLGNVTPTDKEIELEGDGEEWFHIFADALADSRFRDLIKMQGITRRYKVRLQLVNE